MKIILQLLGVLLLLVLGAEITHKYTGFIKDGYWTTVYLTLCLLSGLAVIVANEMPLRDKDD